MKVYRKTATVNAKIFELGDEDGFIHKDGMLGAMEDLKYGCKPDLIPYISTLENQYHKGEFGKHYLCVGIVGEKWLVEKDIFESTYTEVKIEKLTDQKKIANMKKIEFKTSKGEFVLVDLGEYKDLTFSTIVDGDTNIHYTNSNNGENDFKYTKCYHLPDITEEQASEVVDSDYIDFIDKYIYRDYISTNAKEVFCDKLSAIESLHSLLKSKGIDTANGNWYLFKNV